MDQPQRERILDDLRGLIKGELLFDELSRAIYSTDASIFQITPLGIATPRDEEDVQALVRYAIENHLALIPRGAGTGLAGEALGTGIIVDLSRHFRSILSIDETTVRVQPGVVHRELNARLAAQGRRFAPDPTSGVQCTIGGMLATDASGARALRHGYTRDHVERLRVVWDSGDVDELGAAQPASPRLNTLRTQVANLLATHADTIHQHRRRTAFDRCGYRLDDVDGPDGPNLIRLLVGSEGTLGIFTEAVLRTIPLPVDRSVVLLGFDRMDPALLAAHLALPTRPAACELIDRRLVSLARGRGPEFRVLIPAEAEAVLVIEYEGDSRGEAQESARALVARLARSPHPPVYAVAATSADEIDKLWGLREMALPSLYGLRGGTQPVAFVEDVGVPPEELSQYLHRVQEILQRHETTASFLVHAATGQVHTRPFLDLQRTEDVARLWALAEEIHGLAIDLGGTVSSQHGTGLARTPWVERQYGRLYPVLREIKAIFDPQQVLNPGKIIGPDPGLPAWPLRQHPSPAALPLSLRWQPGEVQAECDTCNGCGHCRTEVADQRMCPLFRTSHLETATPRAKANLLRHVLREGFDPRELSSDEVREVCDLCINCRMCAVECPARVSIPKLMLEAKAANVAEHGLDRTDWTLSRTEAFAALASTWAGLVNAGLGSRPVRWFLERFLGVSRKRHLPTFESRNFLRRAARRGWTRRPRGRQPRVAYFVDVFANYNDPEVAEAVVEVLHHNGVEVYVPPKQKGCGMAPLAYGDVEAARETAEHNVRLFADLAREGFPIVCSEPTAALMLKHDYPDLLDDPDAQLVANQVVELTTFLWELHQDERLRTDLAPLDLALGHHVPCHLKALGRPPMGPALLGLIPGVRVHTIDVNCSGMAGTFGLKAQNFELSLAAGAPMLTELGRPNSLFGSTECSTCRMQMEEGSGKRTLHPVQYLALAYGLMPQLDRRLREPIPDLVLR